MKRKRGGLVPRRGSDPVPRPSCWRPKPSPPPDFDRQRQPLQPAPPTRYPAAPLPPLLGRESGSGRPRILPPRPASRASHPLARNPPRGGAAVGGSSEQSPLHRGGCFPGRNASPGTLGGHTAAPRAFARDWTQPGGKEERQGRAGEQCGRLATAARPGKCLCAATRRRTGAGSQASHHRAGSGRFKAGRRRSRRRGSLGRAERAGSQPGDRRKGPAEYSGSST